MNVLHLIFLKVFFILFIYLGQTIFYLFIFFLHQGHIMQKCFTCHNNVSLVMLFC